MNHTPGPWIASGNRIYMGAAMEKREIAVATKSDPSIRHVAEANARLIAAAPDLLQCLEDAEFLMRKAAQIAGPMQDSFRRSAEDARAAIAKAKGEA